MRHRYVYIASGLALAAAAGLIADKTKQQRKYVLPDRINAEGRTTLPNGWRISPAGRHIRLTGDLPMKMIVTADNKLLINTAGWHDHTVNVIDLKTEKLEQTFDVAKDWDGMSLDKSTGTVFISGGGPAQGGFDPEAKKRNLAPEIMDGLHKPVLRLHYEGGRLTAMNPLSIAGMSEE